MTPGARASPYRKVTLAAITIGVFFAAFELIGRFAFPATFGNTRWDHESNHMRLTGFPALNAIMEPDAARFWKLRASVATTQIIGRVGEDDLVFAFSTDAQGFRTTPPAVDARQTVLFVGDSCTLGIAVDDARAIPALVQEMLPGVRCVNAGVPGYSAYQGRIYLESVIRGLQPAAVVINFGFNDDAAWDDLSDLQHGAEAGAPASAWLKSGTARLLTRALRMLPGEDNPTPTSAEARRPRLTDQEFDAELEAMIAVCRENNASAILLVWPLRIQVSQGGTTGKQAKLRRLAVCRQTGIVDLVATVRNSKNSGVDLFADLLHFNDAGCRLAAERIADALRPLLQSRFEFNATSTSQPTKP